MCSVPRLGLLQVSSTHLIEKERAVGVCRLAQRSLRLGTGHWIRGKPPLTRAGGGGRDESGAVLECSFIAGTFVHGVVGGAEGLKR